MVPRALETCVTATSLVLRVEEFLKLVEQKFARVVDRDHAQNGALLLAQDLPGHDVGVMFHGRDDDLVASVEGLPAVTMRDEVDGLGDAAREDDLALRRGMQKVLHFHTGIFIGLRRFLTQVVGTPVNVGIFFRVVAMHCINHHLRFLARGGIVQVDQRFPMHLSLQDGEVFTNIPDIECAVPSPVGRPRQASPWHYSSRLLHPLALRQPGQYTVVEHGTQRSDGNAIHQLTGEGIGQQSASVGLLKPART